MSIEVVCHKIEINKTKSFEFKEDIVSKMIGFKEFEISFSKKQHHVETMSLRLISNQAGKIITITPHIILKDTSGHNADSSSYVTVSVIALTGADEEKLYLENVGNIPSGTQEGNIPISCNAPKIIQAALTGFDLSYGNADHHLKTCLANVGSNFSNKSVSVIGYAEMCDNGSKKAKDPTVDGGLIVDCGFPKDSLQVFSCESLQNSNKEIKIEDGVSYEPFISGFKGTFKDDSRHLRSVTSSLSIENHNNKVIASGYTKLRGGSDSKKVQDDSESHVSGFVLAYKN